MRFLTLLCLTLILAGAVAAEDRVKSDEDKAPTMGPPEEIKAMASLVGSWHVEGELRWDPAVDQWQPYEAKVTTTLVVGGCAYQTVYESTLLGMPYVGMGLETYDRDRRQYQSYWVDNLGARGSYYTGNMVGDSLIMSGDEVYMGITYRSRVVMWNMTESSYEWRMDTSHDNGESWYTTMTANYTKE